MNGPLDPDETQRLVTAGRAANELRHALNNPLAALLAEAQLLELEEITDEQRRSVARMVELCRRMVAIVRTLDGTDDP